MTMKSKSIVHSKQQQQQQNLPSSSRSKMQLFQSMLCASSSSASSNRRIIEDEFDEDYYYVDSTTKSKTTSTRSNNNSLFRSLTKRRIGITSNSFMTSGSGARRRDEFLDNSRRRGIHPAVALLEQNDHEVASLTTKDTVNNGSDDERTERTADPADSFSSFFTSSMNSTTAGSAAPAVLMSTIVDLDEYDPQFSSPDQAMIKATEEEKEFDPNVADRTSTCEKEPSKGVDIVCTSNATSVAAVTTTENSLTSTALSVATKTSKTAALVSSVARASTTTGKSNRSNSSLSWGTVGVRTYETILGDNPSTSSGPPVSIGWTVLQEDSLRLDDYEGYRTEDSIRRKEELVLPSKYREERLMEFGYTRTQMQQRERELEMIKKSRNATAKKVRKEMDGPLYQRLFRKMKA